MSAIYFRPVVSYPTRCIAPAFFARPTPTPISHQIIPLFSLLDESLGQLEQHLRLAQAQRQRQFKRPFNPSFAVKEGTGAYSLEGELPGFDAKDISIEFLDDGHTLQIKGKSVRGAKKEAVADTPAPETPAQTTEASASETESVKAHQATVEDEVEEPANASATATANTAEQAVTETSQPAEQPQQVTEQPKKPEEQYQQQQQPETSSWISSFTKSFKFPGKIDQEAVRASLKDGILAVTLPLARRPESRKIQIE